MDRYALDYARDHLGELIARASRGEEVSISDPEHGEVRLTPLQPGAKLRRGRRLGLLEGKMKLPEGLLDPMSEEELRDWYGDDA